MSQEDVIRVRERIFQHLRETFCEYVTRVLHDIFRNLSSMLMKCYNYIGEI